MGKELVEVSLEDLKRGKPKYLWTESGVEIIAFKEGDSYYAFSSICPHMGGQLRWDERKKALACPWHPLTFCIETGASAHHKFKKVNRFHTRVEGGRLVILTNAKEDGA